MKNKTTIVVPIMGSLNETKSFWGLLINTVGQNDMADLLVIDNSPDEQAADFVDFFRRFVSPQWKAGTARYFHPLDNLGVVKSLQYAYEATETDYLVYIHNDLYIYNNNWISKVEDLFESRTKAGLIGVFGGLRLEKSGMRVENSSNMLEAEIHGHRRTHDYFKCTVIDGMFMACRRSMLDAGDGFDTGYDIHHFYDLDTSMESIKRGFDNYCLLLPVHHVNGVTANAQTFNDWASSYIDGGQMALYQKNQLRFTRKWIKKLPYDVRIS